MYACKMYHNPLRQSCIKEVINGYEISIAFDDSCNESSKIMNRSDIRIFKGNEDLTDYICNQVIGNDSVIIGSLENLLTIYKYCLDN